MKKVVLLILDGWGKRDEEKNNAILQAGAKNFFDIHKVSQHTTLEASGELVGLPDGQMGNSEVGHMNIGAGRIVYQDLVKINHDIENGVLDKNPTLLETFKKANKSTGKVHLIGLVSNGGVHSHTDHFKAVAKIAKNNGINQIFVHAFTDGRDTPPISGKDFVTELDQHLDQNHHGRVVTVCGRFYAMDRDKRWERVEKAYNLLVDGEGDHYGSLDNFFTANYKKGEYDEFLPPTKIGEIDGRIKDGDTVIFMNFRADRARELTHAIIDDQFDHFVRKAKVDVNFVTLTMYEEDLGLPVVYEPETLDSLLGQVYANHGHKQLRIAETEKYAHVTYFFNGGSEEIYKGEDRALLPSPKDVKTYDEKPEMSVSNVTDEFISRFATGDYQLAVINFANPDMIGHTGVEEAAINAVNAVDKEILRIRECCEKMGAALIITADHGNCEQMWDYEEDMPHTQHTLNPVYFVVYNSGIEIAKKKGKLADIAPTILDIAQLPIPKEMTGESLVLK